MTEAKGFIDSNGAIEATARVVADFPTYKPCSMGSNKKLKRESKKESKAPVNSNLKEADGVVSSVLGELLEEVVTWGCRNTEEEETSSSTEGEEDEEEDASEGVSGESESSENISDGELEWLARDLREILAMPENKMAKSVKARGGRRVLKEGLSQVQQKLEQRRRGRKRSKTCSSGRYQRPGYTLIQADTFLGVRKLLSFQALDSYVEEEDEDYLQPDDDESNISEDDEMDVVQSTSSAVVKRARFKLVLNGVEQEASLEQVATEFKEGEEGLVRCLAETLTHCEAMLEEGREEFRVEKEVSGWKLNVASVKTAMATVKNELAVEGKTKAKECKVAELEETVEDSQPNVEDTTGEVGDHKKRSKVGKERRRKKNKGQARALHGAVTKTIDVTNQSKDKEMPVQRDFDWAISENPKPNKMTISEVRAALQVTRPTLSKCGPDLKL